MKYGFKSKVRVTKKKILGKLIGLTLILILVVTFFLLKIFNQNISEQIYEISAAEVKRVTYDFITSKINNQVLNEVTLKDLLKITMNKQGEILYVDFNLDQAYKVLDKVSLVLTKAFRELENGEIDIAYLDSNLTHKVNGMVLNIPLGSALKSLYFYNMGPKIPVRVNFIGSVLTNLETKVTNYGLNNALVEMFVYIEFSNQIMSPFKVREVKLKYDAVIASMMIEGEVPSFYNGVIEKESQVYEKKIEN